MSTQRHEPFSKVWQEEPSQAAYARFESERQALSRAELLPVNLHVPTVVARVYGVCSRLRELHPTLEGSQQSFTLEQLDRLGGLARALSHAYARRGVAHEPDDQLAAFYAEGLRLRADLHSDLLPLIRRGLVPKFVLRSGRAGRTGYKNVASELSALAIFFQEHASHLMTQMCTRPTDLDRARYLSARLLGTVGLRAHGPKVVAAASEDRQRAFTLLLRAYDDLRRAASYLRWHDGDVEKLVPSLWQGRGKRRKKAATVEPEATTESLHKFEEPTPGDASGQEQRSGAS